MAGDMATQGDDIELRGPCPRETIDVIDAMSIARGLTRTQMVNVVLSEWAKARLHEATVLANVTQIHPKSSTRSGT